MDGIRLDEHEFELSGALDRVEAGATVEITREGRPIAMLAPVVAEAPSQDADLSPREQWKAAGIDWEEIGRFAATLPYDPTNSVEEMRREARY